MTSKLKVAGWIAAGAVAGALTTMQFQASARSTTPNPIPLEELQRLSEVFDIVKASYFEPVDEKKLLSNAMRGMVEGLDPHSTYLEGEALKAFRETTSGRFVGVGIEIGMENGLVKVQTPIEGSPAFKAGLKSGDLITKIDQTQVKGLTLDQAVKRMRGESGTKVVLEIARKSESRTFSVEITRAEILTQSIKVKEVEPGYVWVRVTSFQERSVEDFATRVTAVLKDVPSLKGMVLDLRNDPGGLLDGAVGVASAFLPENVEIVSTRGQLASSRYSLTASPKYYLRPTNLIDPIKRLPPAIKTVPLVVLVNEGSASASEIVAGALKDHKRATVMGAQTFGKGSVQSALCLPPSVRMEDCRTAAVKITTARYYTPSGVSIQARGIVPDVMVDESAEGNGYAVLRPREADLEKHISSGQGAEVKYEAREKAREAALKRYEAEREQQKKEGKDDQPKQLPEFGSAEDFQLQQALNRLKGKPVVVSKTMTERKPDEEKSAN